MAINLEVNGGSFPNRILAFALKNTETVNIIIDIIFLISFNRIVFSKTKQFSFMLPLSQYEAEILLDVQTCPGYRVFGLNNDFAIKLKIITNKRGIAMNQHRKRLCSLNK